MPVFDAAALARWMGGRWEEQPSAPLQGVSTDTRALAAGAVYLALQGPRFDGHAFVAQAFARGASAAVVNAAASVTAAGPLLRVGDTAEALRAWAAAYRRHVGLRVVAVTGSVGKTTVKDMTAGVLAALGPTARTRGNWNNEIGLPLSLLHIEPDTRLGVFELGMSHPGELAPLCRVLQPDWGIVTVVGPVHLEFFPSVEAIAREKAELLRQLPPDGAAVLKRDEPYFEILRAAAAGRVVTVAMEGDADYRVLRMLGEGRAEIGETASGERAEIALAVPGRHQIANALFAVAVGRGHGLAWGAIREALAAYRPAAMRWETQTLEGVTIVNDAYNANPISMAAALRTFAQLPVAGRKWVALAGMHELGAAEEAAHQELGRLAAAGPWHGLIVVGALGALIADAAVAAGMAAPRVHRCADTVEAARWLRATAVAGDAVLLKASRGQRLERVVQWWREAAEGGP